jgi:fibronectin-binding autotransporter adhesin
MKTHHCTDRLRRIILQARHSIMTTASVRLLAAAAVAMMIAVSSLPAMAQTQYQWDTTTTGTVITDGSGTWQVGVGNWRTGTSSFAYDQVWANGNNATFGVGTAGAAGTVTLGGNISTNLAVINNGNGNTSYAIDLNGKTWTLGSIAGMLDASGTAEIKDSAGGGSLIPGGGVIRLTQVGATLTISAKVAGTNQVFTASTGDTLFLTNDGNDFTGRLGAQNGTKVSVTSIKNTGVASAAGAGSQVSWGANTNEIIYAGAGDSSNRTLSLASNSNTSTLRSNGTGPLVWTGSFTNTNTVNTTFVLRGTNTGRNEIQAALVNNGAITLAIRKEDAGTWVLSGANTYTAATTVNGGILVFGGTQAKASGTVTVAAAGSVGLGVGGAGSYTSANVTSLFANTLTGFSLNAASGVALDTTAGDFSFAMPASAARNLTKVGGNVLTLTGTYSQSGGTTVLAGGLLFSGTNSGAGLTSVASNAWVGGGGSLAGGLTIAAGGLLGFDPLSTLNVTGAVTLDNSFGVASLVGANGSAINWGSIADGTYTLVGQTASTFNNIQNFGANNAASIGGGRTAYFQNGSLQLVIVPEPGALSLAGIGAAVAAWCAIRRRQP